VRDLCGGISIALITQEKRKMNQSVLPSPGDEEHMLSHGFYNKHSHAQGEANMYGLPLIVEGINQIDLRQIGDEFRMADYGSAQGQNSLLPMKIAIAQIKAMATKADRKEISITVTHTESALAKDPKKYSCRWIIQLMLISKKQK
jgi:hypothetical protein